VLAQRATHQFNTLASSASAFGSQNITGPGPGCAHSRQSLAVGGSWVPQVQNS
jgi:hypothetical protein